MNDQANPLTAQAQDRPQADEQLIWEGVPSWKADCFFIFLSILVILAGFVGFGIWLANGWAVWYFPLAVSLVGFVMFLYKYLKRVTMRYKITTLCLEYEYGILAKTIQNIELWRIKDIVFKQSLRERLLGICQIELVTTDATTPVVILEGLPPGRRIFDDLKKAFMLAKQRRNVLGVVE